MVRDIYRKRVKYALETHYELQANLEILKDEIVQDTAALHVPPGPKTVKFGPDSEGGASNRNQSPEEAFYAKKEEAQRRLEVKRQRYYDQKLLVDAWRLCQDPALEIRLPRTENELASDR